MRRSTIAIWLPAVVLLATCATACTGRRHAATPATSAPAVPALTGVHGCAAPGFECGTLTVALDHTGQLPGTLKLQVALGRNDGAPKGVLLFLAGGPGQSSVGFLPRLAAGPLAGIVSSYRLVMIDQRGTGANALDCPGLQRDVGTSDITTPPAGAVTDCARRLGDMAAVYGTDQTVADIDDLRRALGVPALSIDGVSYGTYVAERYAVTYPDRVTRLVLDSVLPHPMSTDQSLYLTGLRAQARVLRLACQAKPSCGYDPAADLAWLVAHSPAAQGVRIFNLIVEYEFVDRTYRNPNPPGLAPGTGDVLSALHDARTGNPAHLAGLEQDFDAPQAPEQAYSTGLHAATLCADLRFPWGDSSTPLANRAAGLAKALAALPESAVWPYTPAVAGAQGFIQTCLHWPPERPAPNSTGPLPAVPVLLLAGDHDLSTPQEWARTEAGLGSRTELVVVPGARHSVQTGEAGSVGRDAVMSFLLG
jgi:pimeloyl-ACP methyl ester carboxylesterase